MKPQHTRPFNAEHARDGAPYCCADGLEATILKWDCNSSFKLLGVVGKFDIPARWTNDGSAEGGDSNLAMIPLAIIEGRPAFVGDELVDPSGATFRVAPNDCDVRRDVRWPAPAKVYPETKLDHTSLASAALSKHPGTMVCTGAQLYAVANAAIRHAIDAGQVAPISEAKPGVRPHDPYTGRLRDPRDIESDPMGVLICHSKELVRPVDDRLIIGNVGVVHGSARVLRYVANACLDHDPEFRAARELAIAEAVRLAERVRIPGADLDLASIIANVK